MLTMNFVATERITRLSNQQTNYPIGSGKANTIADLYFTTPRREAVLAVIKRLMRPEPAHRQCHRGRSARQFGEAYRQCFSATQSGSHLV